MISPPPNLYRPTIGLFYSSILTCSQSIAAIPKVFIAIFLAALICLFFQGPVRLRIILAATLSLFALNYDRYIGAVNPECLTVDFWSLSFSCLGLFLIGIGQRNKDGPAPPLVAGFILLGLVAAIRGPQLLGGALVLAWCFLGWVKWRRWRTALLSSLAFFTPTLIDNLIRSAYHVTDDARVTFYCVYMDPGHAWTPLTDLRYHTEHPSNGEVWHRYLAFMCSLPGHDFMRWAMNFAPTNDAQLLVSATFVGVLGCGIALAWIVRWRRRSRETEPRSNPGSPWSVWSYRLCLIALIAPVHAMIAAQAGAFFHPVMIVAGIIAVGGMLSGRSIAAAFALCYIGSVILHAAIGLPGSYRVSMTYEIDVFVAVIAFFIEEGSSFRTLVTEGRGSSALALAILLIVAAGYGGNFIGRWGQKRMLREDLAKTNHVMKVSADIRLNRSLYIDGHLIYFYRFYDALPFGSLRTYLKVDAPGGFYSASFLQPCHVIWAR
jgi:hypothetical protein